MKMNNNIEPVDNKNSISCINVPFISEKNPPLFIHIIHQKDGISPEMALEQVYLKRKLTRNESLFVFISILFWFSKLFFVSG